MPVLRATGRHTARDGIALPSQLQLAHKFANLINRDICLKEHHRGYSLVKPEGPHIGFVRFNVKGKNACRYTVYVYGAFDDSQGFFVNETKGTRSRGWLCTVNPDDGDAKRYVIAVLESSYDRK